MVTFNIILGGCFALVIIVLAAWFAPLGIKRGFLTTFWLPPVCMALALIFRDPISAALGYHSIILLFGIALVSLVFGVIGTVLIFWDRSDWRARALLLGVSFISATPALVVAVFLCAQM